MQKFNLTVSIVLYQTDIGEVNNILRIFSQVSLTHKIFLVDNSPTDDLKGEFQGLSNVEYIFTGKNLGFGSGHNLAINIIKEQTEYHLVLNADVNFEGKILEEIFEYMSKNNEIGLLAPKIFNPDGSIQYSAKLLPTPMNLIVRRFVPIKWLQNKLDTKYEFRFFSFDNIIEVPYVMGCFMFISANVFRKIDGFDERFFMYPEDIDLTRRIHNKFKTIYYPKATITHTHGKGSYKSSKLLYYHVTSMIKYFNKWGWFFDSERIKINKKVLAQFKDVK